MSLRYIIEIQTFSHKLVSTDRHYGSVFLIVNHVRLQLETNKVLLSHYNIFEAIMGKPVSWISNLVGHNPFSRQLQWLAGGLKLWT